MVKKMETIRLDDHVEIEWTVDWKLGDLGFIGDFLKFSIIRVPYSWVLALIEGRFPHFGETQLKPSPIRDARDMMDIKILHDHRYLVPGNDGTMV